MMTTQTYVYISREAIAKRQPTPLLASMSNAAAYKLV